MTTTIASLQGAAGWERAARRLGAHSAPPGRRRSATRDTRASKGRSLLGRPSFLGEGRHATAT